MQSMITLLNIHYTIKRSFQKEEGLFQKVLQLFEKALDVLFHSNVKTYLSMVTKVISPALIKSLWLMRYLLYFLPSSLISLM